MTRLLPGAMLMVVLTLTTCSSEQGSQVQDSEVEQETQAPPEEEPAPPPPRTEELVPATGVLEKPEITTYMYGTHAVMNEASGERYALQSEDVDLDVYIGRRVTVYGTPAPGYENGQIEGGPPLLDVTRVEPA